MLKKKGFIYKLCGINNLISEHELRSKGNISFKFKMKKQSLAHKDTEPNRQAIPL